MHIYTGTTNSALASRLGDVESKAVMCVLYKVDVAGEMSILCKVAPRVIELEPSNTILSFVF
jgi:hypothetical protein